jgi:hypothetical protein
VNVSVASLVFMGMQTRNAKIRAVFCFLWGQVASMAIAVFMAIAKVIYAKHRSKYVLLAL